jgi:hypothetical protein
MERNMKSTWIIVLFNSLQLMSAAWFRKKPLDVVQSKTCGWVIVDIELYMKYFRFQNYILGGNNSYKLDTFMDSVQSVCNHIVAL